MDPKSLVESMSTRELRSAIQLAEADGGKGVHPSPRLLERLQEEWEERPLQDRLAAEAALHVDEAMDRGPGLGSG